MIETKITQLMGVKYPIICGAMMWICTPRLCAAISNAGGLGNITAAVYETEDAFRKAIQETKKLTDKPFLVNISIHPSMRITEKHHAMYLKVCVEEKVAGLEISGAPLDRAFGMEMIDTLKKADIKLFQKVGSVKHAKHAAQVGYDGVYAAGWEEAGHPLSDDVTTMVLTPTVVDAIDIPVVTCGGIADGRTMAAALSLGAEGVMMGTRFVVTEECNIHPNIKNHLVELNSHDTTMICKSIGVQCRAINNKTAHKVLEVENKGGELDELMQYMSGIRGKEALEKGDPEHAILTAGQSLGLINGIISCEELIEQMVSECVETLKKNHNRLTAQN